jgi:hypothetical protein
MLTCLRPPHSSRLPPILQGTLCRSAGMHLTAQICYVVPLPGVVHRAWLRVCSAATASWKLLLANRYVQAGASLPADCAQRRRCAGLRRWQCRRRRRSWCACFAWSISLSILSRHASQRRWAGTAACRRATLRCRSRRPASARSTHAPPRPLRTPPPARRARPQPQAQLSCPAGRLWYGPLARRSVIALARYPTATQGRYPTATQGRYPTASQGRCLSDVTLCHSQRVACMLQPLRADRAACTSVRS